MARKSVKRQVVASISAVLCALLLYARPLGAETGIEIMLTGEFHGNEINATTGESWFGLFRSGPGFRLTKTPVAVEYVEDAVLDSPGEKTGKRVGVESADEPLFLVRGLPDLKEGPVDVSFDGWDWLKPGVKKELELSGTTWSLCAYGHGKDDWSIEDYSLALGSGGVTQELARFETCCDDTMPALIWAGDIDRDGMLDFFVELSNHYNVARRTLFLSTLAGQGELVGKAAEFVTYGC